MFSNEHPNHRRRSYSNPPKSGPSPSNETTLLRHEIQIERKEFSVMLKENPRGRFIRVVERNGNHVASIIVPVTGLKDFQVLFETMAKAAAEIPSKSENPS